LNSIVDGTLVFLLVLAPFIESTAIPDSISRSRFIKSYELYVIYFVVRSLGLMSSFISLKISVDRLLVLIRPKVKKFTENKTGFKVTATAFFFASFSVFLPKWFYFDIVPDKSVARPNTTDKYEVYKIIVLQSRHSSSYISLSNLIAPTTALGLMTLVNIVLILTAIASIKRLTCLSAYNRNKFAIVKSVQFSNDRVGLPNVRFNISNRDRFRRPKGIHWSSLIMTIWITVIHQLHHFMAILLNVHFLNKPESFYNPNILFLIYLSLIISHSSNVIVYCIYNRKFAWHFKRHFKKQFACVPKCFFGKKIKRRFNLETSTLF
jgi:hypothetical protein